VDGEYDKKINGIVLFNKKHQEIESTQGLGSQLMLPDLYTKYIEKKLCEMKDTEWMKTVTSSTKSI
jgi:hypothetical protein